MQQCKMHHLSNSSRTLCRLFITKRVMSWGSCSHGSFLTGARTGLRMVRLHCSRRSPLPWAFGHENCHPANRLVRPLCARSWLPRTAEVRDESEDGGAGVPDTPYVARAV